MIGSQFISLDEFNKIFEVEKMQIESQFECKTNEGNSVTFTTHTETEFMYITAFCGDEDISIKLTLDEFEIMSDAILRKHRTYVVKKPFDASGKISQLLADKNKLIQTKQYADDIANQLIEEQNKC